ncbi:hypothetical protein [Endozoicomonas sp. Mp262]|uniref:hypothetical protein n=1 Tax=Endozoicomonas sp. Mp262 TaxID=2919499 RepID=UPI0021DA6166
MARDGAKWYHDEEELLSDEGHALRKQRSARDRCKKRKASTIRQGIDHYYTKKNQHGGYDEFDDPDDSLYH